MAHIEQDLPPLSAPLSDSRQQFLDELTALSKKHGLWLDSNHGEGTQWYGVKIIPESVWDGLDVPDHYVGNFVYIGDIIWLELEWPDDV